MDSFLLLGREHLCQISLSCPLDICTRADPFGVPSQPRKKTTHLFRKSWLWCIYHDAINLFSNYFFLPLVDLRVNATSSWYIHFREKSDSESMGLNFFFHLSKLTTIDHPCLNVVIWSKQELIYSSHTILVLTFDTCPAFAFRLPLNHASSSCISLWFPGKVSFLHLTVLLYQSETRYEGF